MIKLKEKLIAILLIIALMFSGLCIDNSNTVKAESTDAEQWKAAAITSPKQDKLIGAGYIDIKWENTLENVSQYKVYVDSKLKKTLSPTSSKTMSCEFYTTKVSAHYAYIIAVLKDGTNVRTATRRFYVTKKGICVNDVDMGEAVDPASMNIGWYYNWGWKSFKDTNYKNTKFYDLEFVPMVWGDDAYTIYEKFEHAKTQEYKYMLGYNEPDLQWESNLDVNTLCNRWYDFTNYKGSNMRLGSPAVSTFPTWSSNWWEPYWKRVKANKKLGFDFIAVHSYQGNYDGKKSALQYLQAIDECYETYGKPIWVTEFALAGSKWFSINNTSDCKKAQEFMKIVIKGLNERSYVERYSWFCFSAEPTATDSQAHERAGASAIFKYSTGELTTLGKIYAQLGNPAGYKAKTYGVTSNISVDTSPKACAASIPTTLYSVKGKKKSFKYEIKSVSKAAGYQIQYSLNKKFKKAKKYKTKTKSIKASNKKTVKGTIKKLKKKKKYYVRVRAYKILNGKKLYCKWSSREKVKTK